MMGRFCDRVREAARAGGPDAAAGLVRALDAVAAAEELDAITEPLGRVVRGLPLGRLRGVLQGRALGHPLHPAVVQVPVGAWVSAAVLDLVPGAERQARLLVALGLAAFGPAAWTGWVDWAEQRPPQRRTGLVHLASVATAGVLYGGSLAARMSGRRGVGRALGFAGLAAVGAGAFVGGHLAYRQSAGTNKAEPVPHLVRPGWHLLGPVADFPVGRPSRRMVGEVPVLVVRQSPDVVHVLADRCSHASGALSDGEITDGCVRCPLHGSVFRLADGWNVDGPATAPQPRFDTRIDDDGLHVRLPAVD